MMSVVMAWSWVCGWCHICKVWCLSLPCWSCYIKTICSLKFIRGSCKGASGGHFPPVRCLAPFHDRPPEWNLYWVLLDICDDNLAIMCWFYIENSIFEHMIDKFFWWPAHFGDLYPPPTGSLKLELLECPLFWISHYLTHETVKFI